MYDSKCLISSILHFFKAILNTYLPISYTVEKLPETVSSISFTFCLVSKIGNKVSNRICKLLATRIKGNVLVEMLKLAEWCTTDKTQVNIGGLTLTLLF